MQFGSLQVTPRVCNTRPQTEAPQTTSFVEVDEQDTGKNEAKRIFSGWMFAASPGLHGVEHPVYDVWLIDCKGGKEIVQAPAAEPAAAGAGARRSQPAPHRKEALTLPQGRAGRARRRSRPRRSARAIRVAAPRPPAPARRERRRDAPRRRPTPKKKKRKPAAVQPAQAAAA